MFQTNNLFFAFNLRDNFSLTTHKQLFLWQLVHSLLLKLQPKYNEEKFFF